MHVWAQGQADVWVLTVQCFLMCMCVCACLVCVYVFMITCIIRDMEEAAGSPCLTSFHLFNIVIFHALSSTGQAGCCFYRLRVTES